MANKVTVGLIGYGYWGPNYARIIDNTEYGSLKWVVDLDAKLLAKAKNAHPSILTSNNIKDCLNDKEVDAVIICTPTSTHYTVAKAALESGKHVLVEKPLTTSSQEGSELINIASLSNLKLMTGHTYLFNPGIKYLKEQILAGNLGNLLFFYSEYTNLGPIRSDVNVLWDLGPHNISTILYLSDEKPISVIASGSCYLNQGHYDVCTVNIEFTNNVFVSMLISWLAPIKIRKIDIIADKKMAIFDDMDINGKVRILNKNIINIEKGQTISFSEFKNITLYQGETLIPSLDAGEPLRDQLVEFITAISEDRGLKFAPEHGLEVVKILEAADKSLKEGKKIQI